MQHTTVLVDHQGGQGFTVHLFGQDHQWGAGLLNRLEHRHQIGDGAHLPIGQQQQCVVEFAQLTVTVGDEIGRAVAAVEGHSFGHFQLGGEGL